MTLCLGLIGLRTLAGAHHHATYRQSSGAMAAATTPLPAETGGAMCFLPHVVLRLQPPMGVLSTALAGALVHRLHSPGCALCSSCAPVNMWPGRLCVWILLIQICRLPDMSVQNPEPARHEQ